MDASPTQGGPVLNWIVFNFDLSQFDVQNDNIHLDFAYMSHGEEQGASDMVLISTAPNQPWIPFFDLYQNRATPGTWKVVTDISISDVLINSGLQFTSTIQISKDFVLIIFFSSSFYFLSFSLSFFLRIWTTR